DATVNGVQTCALPISTGGPGSIRVRRCVRPVALDELVTPTLRSNDTCGRQVDTESAVTTVSRESVVVKSDNCDFSKSFSHIAILARYSEAIGHGGSIAELVAALTEPRRRLGEVRAALARLD